MVQSTLLGKKKPLKKKIFFFSSPSTKNVLLMRDQSFWLFPTHPEQEKFVLFVKGSREVKKPNQPKKALGFYLAWTI